MLIKRAFQFLCIFQTLIWTTVSPGHTTGGAPLAPRTRRWHPAPLWASARLPQGEIQAPPAARPPGPPQFPAFAPPLGVSGSSPGLAPAASLWLRAATSLLLPAGFQACFVCDAVVLQRALRPQGTEQAGMGPSGREAGRTKRLMPGGRASAASGRLLTAAEQGEPGKRRGRLPGRPRKLGPRRQRPGRRPGPGAEAGAPQAG